jgi:limonene-1,2-epoxide hydrolase
MTPLAAWARFWEELTPEAIGRLDRLCVPDARFVDPFNDIKGTDRLAALLTHMFATVSAPRFVVHDQAMGAKAGYLRWRFTGKAGWLALDVEGMSEVRLAADGRVVAHRDHWDAGAQVYGRVPLLGAGIALVRKRLSLPAS